ncbi:MAG: hypothetical protein AW12_02384 [Candidatus Accumulibacter sp. BA-94]|nr:MAG: hypothetical protein AW12_02384 [Candidatus Accumulibacter sp. BA-94]
MSGPARAKAVEHLPRFDGDPFRRGEEHRRVDISLQRDPLADAPARFADVDRPVQADRIASDIGDRFQPQAPALGKHDRRHALPVLFLDQPADDALHVLERELFVGRCRKRTSPGIKDHHRLGAGFDLGVEVGTHSVGGDRQDVMQQVRPIVEHALDPAVIGARRALDHVAGQGVGAPGKADKWHRAVQRAPDLGHGIHHVAQVVPGVRCAEVANRPLLAQRALEARAFAVGEVEAEPHRIRDGEDVGKEDRRVELVAGKRLQGHLTGQAGILAQLHEAARARARLAILGQIATGLAHQPDRRVGGRLLEQGAQETVVAWSGHVELHRTGKLAWHGTPRAGAKRADRAIIPFPDYFRQKAGVMTTSRVKISRRPRSMAKVHTQV